jgi:hypothetical protein
LPATEEGIIRLDGTKFEEQTRIYVVCSIAMIVDPTKERSRRVLPNILDQEMSSARMLVNEIGNVMNETRNKDKWALRRLLLDCKE